MSAYFTPEQLAAEHVLQHVGRWRRALYRNRPPLPRDRAREAADAKDLAANMRFLRVPVLMLLSVAIYAATQVGKDDSGPIGAAAINLIAYFLILLGVTTAAKVTLDVSMSGLFAVAVLLASVSTKLLGLSRSTIVMVGGGLAMLWLAVALVEWLVSSTRLEHRPALRARLLRLMYRIALPSALLTYFVGILVALVRRLGEGRTPPPCPTPGCGASQRDLAVACRRCASQGCPAGFLKLSPSPTQPFVALCPSCGHEHHVWNPRRLQESVDRLTARCARGDWTCTQEPADAVLQVVLPSESAIAPVLELVATWANGGVPAPLPPGRVVRLPMRLTGEAAVRSLAVHLLVPPLPPLHGGLPTLLVLPALGPADGHPRPSLRAAVDNLAVMGETPRLMLLWLPDRGTPPADHPPLVTAPADLRALLGVPLASADAHWHPGSTADGGTP